MMLISKLRREAPIAVKLYENYMGEWFFNGIRDVIDTVTPWLSNAQVVGQTVKGWINSASTNDGYINPQSFVKGPVAPKVMKEKADKTKPKPKKVTQKIPNAPGPAPAMRAYRPKPITTVMYTSQRPGSKKRPHKLKSFENTKEDRKRRKKVMKAKAAQGVYTARRR